MTYIFCTLIWVDRSYLWDVIFVCSIYMSFQATFWLTDFVANCTSQVIRSGRFDKFFGQSDTLKWPLYCRHIYLRAHILTKFLYKLVQPENVLIQNICKVEMYKKCPKVLYLVISALFLTLWRTTKRHPIVHSKYKVHTKYIPGFIKSL